MEMIFESYNSSIMKKCDNITFNHGVMLLGGCEDGNNRID